MSNKDYSGFFVGLVLAVSVGGWGYLAHYMDDERKAETELIKPRMLELAQQGHSEAIRWAYEHDLSDLKDANELYARLSELGDPSAMFSYAYRLELQGDLVSAQKWYEKSAAVGFPRAVLKIAKPEKGIF